MRLARRKSRGGTHHNAPGNRISTSLGCILAGVERLSTTRRAHKSFVQLIRFNNQIRKLKLFWEGHTRAAQTAHLRDGLGWAWAWGWAAVGDEMRGNVGLGWVGVGWGGWGSAGMQMGLGMGFGMGWEVVVVSGKYMVGSTCSPYLAPPFSKLPSPPPTYPTLPNDEACEQVVGNIPLHPSPSLSSHPNPIPTPILAQRQIPLTLSMGLGPPQQKN